MRYAVLATIVFYLAACGEARESPSENNSGTNNGAPNNGSANNGGGTNNGATNNGQATVTYHQDIKPIIDGRCVDCHYDGGLGPISFESYEEVFGARHLIADVTKNRTMPPFLPGPDCNDFKHDPSLTDEQISLFQTWVEEGGAEGDPTNPGEVLESVGGSGLSRVDLTLEMPEPYVPKKSPDDYRCFVLDWPHQTTKYVTGFNVKPGNDATVHHVIAFLAPPSLVAEAEANDAAEDGLGYTCFGAPGIGGNSAQDLPGWLGSWAPGTDGGDLPEGTGLEIPAGSKVVLQVHYNTLTAAPEPDQTAVEFKLDDQVQKTAMWLPWANPLWLNGTMPIPAGAEDTSHSFMYDPTQFIGGSSIEIWMGGLHMHLLGKSARTWIRRKDGTEDCMIDIPRWDFNWQAAAVFEEPMRLNPGDQIALECHWDNSAANQPTIDGEKIQPADRNWGEGTTDEMCLGLYYVTLAD